MKVYATKITVEFSFKMSQPIQPSYKIRRSQQNCNVFHNSQNGREDIIDAVGAVTEADRAGVISVNMCKLCPENQRNFTELVLSEHVA